MRQQRMLQQTRWVGGGAAGACLCFSCQPQERLTAGLPLIDGWAGASGHCHLSTMPFWGLPLLQEAEAEAAAEQASEEENKAEL
jgi:hypothetical protein